MKILLFFLLIGVNALTAQTYFLNGDAEAIGNDCYQLTGLATYENGTVWYADQIDLTQPFDLQFLMNFGNLDGGGADGICFVLQTVGTSAIGVEGGGLGYLNFGTSLGIEFDTWQNGEYNDIGEDHIAIEMNGDINHNSANNIAGPIQADPLDQNIEDGEDHVVRVVWNPDDQIIQVYFDCVFRLSGEIDLINTIFGGVSDVYWGFTAATGGSFNNQIVCLQESILNQTESVLMCTGSSTTLNAGASSDGIYTWSPTTFLDDPSSGSPLCSAPSSTSYTVNFNDLCNAPTQLTFVVNVEDLEVNVSGIETLNCTNTSALINANINIDLAGEFTWTVAEVEVASGLNLNSVNTTQAGQYNVSVNVQDMCFADVDFEIPSNFSTYEVDAGPDVNLNCNGNALALEGSYDGTGAQTNWLWNGAPFGSANELNITVTEPGNYMLVVLHPLSGCSSSDTLVVGEDFAVPEIAIGEQDSLTCVYPVLEIANVSITASNEYVASWTTDNGGFAGGQNTQNAFVNAPGVYTLTVTDAQSGCSSEESIYIGTAQNFNVDLSSLTFPNVITSNGDSKNERWHPFLRNNPLADISSVFGVFELVIYNRWGMKVFESSSYNSAWTGKEQEEGTYYYILEYSTNCDNKKSGKISGNVQLLK